MGVTVSEGMYIFSFDMPQNFPKWYNNLLSYQQCMRVSVSLPHQNLFILNFPKRGSSLDLYFIVVLFYMSSATSKAEHLVICLLAIWTSFLKYLLKPPLFFLISSLFLTCLKKYCILDTSTNSFVWIIGIFHSVTCLFALFFI